MAQFRKKRTAWVQAEQWSPGASVKGVCFCPAFDGIGRTPHVHTTHQGQTVEIQNGDWVIKEPNGDGYYPCKPEIFEATYEPVD